MPVWDAAEIDADAEDGAAGHVGVNHGNDAQTDQDGGKDIVLTAVFDNCK